MLRDLFSLFPAYAGVIPKHKGQDIQAYTFPRIRGGDPGISLPASNVNFFSPHMRG